MRLFTFDVIHTNVSNPPKHIFCQVPLISQRCRDNSLYHTAPKIAYWLPGNAIRFNQSPQFLLDEAFQEASHDSCHNMLSSALLQLWHSGRSSASSASSDSLSLSILAAPLKTFVTSSHHTLIINEASSKNTPHTFCAPQLLCFGALLQERKRSNDGSGYY